MYKLWSGINKSKNPNHSKEDSVSVLRIVRLEIVIRDDCYRKLGVRFPLQLRGLISPDPSLENAC